MKSLIKIFILIIGFSSIIQSQASLNLSKKDLKRVYKMMKGSFNSSIQAAADTNYFNISLKMTPVWKKRKDGYWLYVEQAMTTALDNPYRQRIYHLYKQDNKTIVSKVYEVKDVKKYTGSWKNEVLLNSMSDSLLIDRQGCSIFLHKTVEGTFSGSTPGKECLSTMRGATYATSEVTIYKDKIISWDRGWSIDDKYLWGAEFGGYHFVKEKE
jgi:CpeT protein